MSAYIGRITAGVLVFSLLLPFVSRADDPATPQDELQRELATEAQQREAALAAAAKRKEALEKVQAMKAAQQREELKKAEATEARQQSSQQRSEWITQLVGALRNNWAYPPGTDRRMKAFEEITLSPTGQVESATIKQSSGSTIFDETLLRAAYKASPLPLPARPELFVPHLVICFSPEPANCR